MPADSNRKAAEAFANQFDPPLKIVGTEKIDGSPVANGFAVNWYDQEKEIGLTAVIWGNGHMKAYLEAVGTTINAEEFGKFLARSIGKQKKPDGIKTDGRSEESAPRTVRATNRKR